MKKFVILLWIAAIMGCLTVMAHADAIVGPVAYVILAGRAVYRLWPWILVAVVVIITLVMLKKYRRK